MPPPRSDRQQSARSAAAVAATCAEFGLTAAEFAELHRRSVAAKAAAYCPYSQFRVGAALLSADADADAPVYFAGANVENASYPVGTCAERVALGTAVTQGHRRFRAVAVATDIAPPASPCGMCRQLWRSNRVAPVPPESIREFSEPSIPIIMFDKDDDYTVFRLEELLPLSFGPDALPPPRPRQ
ncbi:cytidine deaminase-like protein [Durotheca rogersii]|uniref:cytidine deaminase-like protein n=1 Tax=Durotheca rogersii TaxID=419775 RepID=UPI0022212078|nr:cytidine deaminase-like protein [Durotheca rogersii]KAI5866885.1 cytidine deaminase-like protein [Durotheca rogersii]